MAQPTSDIEPAFIPRHIGDVSDPHRIAPLDVQVAQPMGRDGQMVVAATDQPVLDAERLKASSYRLYLRVRLSFMCVRPNSHIHPRLVHQTGARPARGGRIVALSARWFVYSPCWKDASMSRRGRFNALEIPPNPENSDYDQH